MTLFAVYYYTKETIFGNKVYTEELITSSLVTAQMVCAELIAEGRDAWVEQIQ